MREGRSRLRYVRASEDQNGDCRNQNQKGNEHLPRKRGARTADTHLGEEACYPGLAGAVFLSVLLLVLWRGREGQRTNHSRVSVCRSCAGRPGAGRFPQCRCGLGPGTPSRLRRGRKVSGIHPTSKIQAPVPSGSEAAKCPPEDFLRACGKRTVAMVIR